MSDVETIEMEVHQLLKGDVDTGLVCLSGADLDELVEANRALELENRALREFVAANDKHESFRETVPTDGYELWIAEWEHLKREAWKARQRLATDHGIPLPGEGVEG